MPLTVKLAPTVVNDCVTDAGLYPEPPGCRATTIHVPIPTALTTDPLIVQVSVVEEVMVTVSPEFEDAESVAVCPTIKYEGMPCSVRVCFSTQPFVAMPVLTPLARSAFQNDLRSASSC